MEDQFYMQRCQAQSQMILTLKRQIDGLLPLRTSFNDLQSYYDKITADLQSLISEHNYVNEALKQTKQNLTLIGMKTEEDRNSLITKLQNIRNQHTKLTIETKSAGQKMQIMTEKLKLQSNRQEQNLNYKQQLQQMLQALKSHIQSLQACLQDLTCNITCLTDKLTQTQINSQRQIAKNKDLIIKGEQTKDKIAHFDIKNDDLVDGNRKLTDQIRSKEQQLNLRHKINREAREKIIGLAADLEKLRNQSDYKQSLIQAEKTAQLQLQNHQFNIIKAVENVSQQKQIVNKQNCLLQTQINEMQKARQQNISFKLNSEQHFNEIKRANDSLFSKMQNYCLQDRDIQSILLKKMASLQACSRRFNKMTQFKHEQSMSNSFKEHLIFKERRFNDNSNLYERGIWSKKDQMNEAHNTRSSEKSPWRKENFA